jgi:hypothetical protein
VRTEERTRGEERRGEERRGEERRAAELRPQLRLEIWKMISKIR